MRKWRVIGLCESELEARSLSSRNTLGDTTHNTNKIGLRLSELVAEKAMVVLCGNGGGMRKCMWAPEQNWTKVRR